MNTISKNIAEMINVLTAEQQIMIYEAVKDMMTNANISSEEKEIHSKYNLECLDCY
ncbi:hypothetical protein [Proteocatella sphenisci]|uniref:hypothetical protein n=1 Tax=Proteocatella sphenisci TaxID=181070 RepID=UPI0004B76D9D|nr:hypothetical protein [Proteocatella sphenisci]